MPVGPVNYRMAETLRRAKRVGSGDTHKRYDPYDTLRCAIVEQAILDWMDGQKILMKRHGVSNLQELHKKFPDGESWHKVCSPKILIMIDAERFFKNEFCEDLCGVDGREILKRLKAGQVAKPVKPTASYTRNKQAA